MELRNPLFIVGTGRCGSSALHQLLSHHPHLAWLSQLCARFPAHPEVNRLAMLLLDSGLPSEFVRKHVRPSEAYAYWDHHFPGFSEPCRDLVREDVNGRIGETLRASLSQMLTPQRHRLLIKITGWPRVGFLKAIFPDARFVHVYRDGRAVACSLLERPWWGGWQGWCR